MVFLSEIRVPPLSIHLMLDGLLKKDGIISKKDYTIIHHFIDRDFYNEMPLLCRVNNKIDVPEVKAWLAKFCYMRSQKIATNYLRVMLAHVLTDFLWETFVFQSDLDFLRVAYLTFKSSGYGELTYVEHSIIAKVPEIVLVGNEDHVE